MKNVYATFDKSHVKPKEIIFVVITLVLPLIFTMVWLARNTQLPGNDAANYLMTAVDIYHHFVNHGFWKGLLNCYLNRGWRPIFFPVLAVPFLFITHGNLYAAYSAIAGLCMLVSTIYLYLFFRLKLNHFSSILAANIIVMLPLVQAQILMFYAEAAFFPCIIGCIYHLIKSDFLRNIKHVSGFILLLTLAFIIRPVEAATHLIFVFGVFLFLGWYKKVFSVKQIIAVLAIAFSGLSLLFLVSVIPYFHFNLLHVIDNGGVLDKKMAYIFFGGLIVAIIGALLAWSIVVIINVINSGIKLNLLVSNYLNKPLLIPAFTCAVTLILFWFLPFVAETLQWVYRTSLGDVASSTGSLTGAKFSWNLLHIYVRAESMMMVIAIILLAIISWFSLSKQERQAIIFSQPFIYLLLITPIPFWETFYTVQIVIRKLSVAFPVILMAMLMLVLQYGRGWIMRVSSVGLLLILQIFLMFVLIFTQTSQQSNFIIKNTIGYFIPQPVTLQPNSHDAVEKFLTTQAQSYHFKSIALEVNPGTPDARHPVDAEPIDPFLLSTMLVALNRNYSASYPYFGNFSENNIANLGQHYDAIFLSDSADNMLVSTNSAKDYYKKYLLEPSASLKVFYKLLSYYSGNQLTSIGWKLGPCLTIKSVNHGDYRGCLLLLDRK